MDFILNNIFFDISISFLLIINTITTLIISLPELKKNLKNNEEEKVMTKLDYFKLITNILFILVFAILLVIIADKYKILPFFTLLYHFSFFFAALKLAKKNIVDLSAENKMSYIQIAFLFSIFFSNKVTEIYINNFSGFSHTTKEYLLIIFLILKLIFFIYCIIINFSIFVSNLSIIFNKQLSHIKSFFVEFLNKNIELKLYDFYFYNKHNKLFYLILDAFIYILLCPFSIILHFIFSLCFLFMKVIIQRLLKLYKKTFNYFNNSSKIIEKTLKISSIMSLIIVYIIIIYNNNIFSNNTQNIFSLLSTVILIPLIYDSIKTKE